MNYTQIKASLNEADRLATEGNLAAAHAAVLVAVSGGATTADITSNVQAINIKRLRKFSCSGK